MAGTVLPAVLSAGRDPVPNCRFAAARCLEGLGRLLAADPAAAQAATHHPPRAPAPVPPPCAVRALLAWRTAPHGGGCGWYWCCAALRRAWAQVRTALEGLRADPDPDVQHFARLAIEALA